MVAALSTGAAIMSGVTAVSTVIIVLVLGYRLRAVRHLSQATSAYAHYVAFYIHLVNTKIATFSYFVTFVAFLTFCNHSTSPVRYPLAGRADIAEKDAPTETFVYICHPQWDHWSEESFTLDEFGVFNYSA